MKREVWMVVNGVLEKKWLDVEPGTDVQQIGAFVRYTPPRKNTMTNIFLMILSIILTVLIGLWIYL